MSGSISPLANYIKSIALIQSYKNGEEGERLDTSKVGFTMF